MNTDLLIAVMTFFVFLAAVALCIQAGLLFGIYRSTRAIQEQALSIMPQVKSILTKADATLDESRKTLGEITAKANTMMDLGKAQLVKLDSVLTDASARAKVQIERADLVIDDTVSRVHHAVTAVHSGIVRPINEVQGLVAGVRAAVEHFIQGNRPSVAQATQDDEMFI
jgi:hypothetical protein